MGKKTPEQEADISTITGDTSGGIQSLFNWVPLSNEYKEDKSAGSTNRTFSEWLEWKANEITRPKFQPPTYEPKEFPQLPVTPSAPSGTSTPRGQAPNPQVINRYLEQVMSKVGGEGSGQTEVGKALRAKSSGGEK